MKLSPTLRILRETRGGRKLRGLAVQTLVHSWWGETDCALLAPRCGLQRPTPDDVESGLVSQDVLHAGIFSQSPDSRALENEARGQGSEAGTSRPSEVKNDESVLGDLSLAGLGPTVLQVVLEVLPLRSQPMAGVKASGLFPLPTSREYLQEFFEGQDQGLTSWLISLCISLNCLWGDGSYFCDARPEGFKRVLVKDLANEVQRLSGIKSSDGIEFDWTSFFKSRTVDYQGEEVKIARSFSWANIAPALPKEIGKVPLSDICDLGRKFYVDNIDLYLKPVAEWKPLTYPRVMVADEDWGAVCSGLVSAGVCTYLLEEEVFSTDSGLLLNGLFGVTKDEFVGGVEVFRLIMNLVPLTVLPSRFRETWLHSQGGLR